jgi:hypothetical protein
MRKGSFKALHECVNGWCHCFLFARVNLLGVLPFKSIGAPTEAMKSVVIEWTLSAGEQAQRYPGANKADIRWYAGQPVSLAFRWAANSQASPGAPKENSDALFVVNGKQALWAADGPWALFQLFRQFQIEAGSMNLSGHGMPLGASIPTNDQSKSYVTRVFFQINAVSEVDGTKELLPPPVFPMGPAPMTPFGIRAGNSTMEGVSNAR